MLCSVMLVCTFDAAACIVGKSDFASGNRFWGDYCSEFSGVFFRFCFRICLEYFFGFFNQNEVKTFFLFFLGLTSIFLSFPGYFSEFSCIFPSLIIVPDFRSILPSFEYFSGLSVYFSELLLFFRVFEPKWSEDLCFGLTGIFPDFQSIFWTFSIFPNFAYSSQLYFSGFPE